MQCPCCSKLEFNQCCEPLLNNSETPKTAESLMRARYTAFVQNNMKFVRETHDPDTFDEEEFEANVEWADEAEWSKLEIIATQMGSEKDLVGIVEFKAHYETNENEEVHHERSTFTKKNGKWFFTKGDYPKYNTIQREDPKIGRNDPCDCGSGKKFKKCCGKN